MSDPIRPLPAPAAGADLPPVEAWLLGAGDAAAVPPGVVVRRAATAGFGTRVRLGVEGEVWGWIREDKSPRELLRAYPDAVLDLELRAWPGTFGAGDAARLGRVAGVTTHGYPVERYRDGLRALAAAGARVYPQLYRPKNPLAPEAFAARAIALWVGVGFPISAVVGVVSARDGEYGLKIAQSLLRAGAGVAVWGWQAAPSRARRAFLSQVVAWAGLAT